MKITLIALISLISTISLANEPIFKCVEQTGFQYKFYLMPVPQIEVRDDKNQLLDVIQGLELEYKSADTDPSIDSYSFKLINEGNEFAIVEFLSTSKHGHGEMIDNDNTLTCERAY